MSDVMVGVVKEMAHAYGRSVFVAYAPASGSWRAECMGEVAQSIVGPEDALKQLRRRLEEREGRCRRKTEMMPAAGKVTEREV